MTVLALASVKASPGVTTLAVALALTWPAGEGRCVRLVEADPDGGVLAARLGLRADPNLATLASASRRGLSAELLIEHGQALTRGVHLLAGSVSPERMHASLASLRGLHDALGRDASTDSIVDTGRLSPRSPVIDLARQAGMTLLVARPARDEVEAVGHRAQGLREVGCAVGLVCVTTRSAYPVSEFADAAGIELVGVIGDDRRAADALRGDAALSDRGLARSSLYRHAADLGIALAERLRPRAGGRVGESTEADRAGRSL